MNSVLAKLLSKKVKSASADDVKQLHDLHHDIVAVSRKLARINDGLQQYAQVPANIQMMSKDLMLYSYKVKAMADQLESGLLSETQVPMQDVIRTNKNGNPVFDTSKGFSLEELKKDRFAYVNHDKKLVLPSFGNKAAVQKSKDDFLAMPKSIEIALKNYQEFYGKK